MTFKVCILTAGKGSRMGKMGLKLNKALLPIKSKAIISHIISKFPSETKFVIALGYLGYQVKNYLEIAHSDLDIDYVEVKNFDKIGSGPGKSLLSCKKKLQTDFFFISCDTLWNGKIKLNKKKQLGRN